MEKMYAKPFWFRNSSELHSESFVGNFFNYGPSPLLQVEYTLGLGGQQLEVKMYSAFCFSIFLSFLVVVLFKWD